jgi:hypothetical protein
MLGLGLGISKSGVIIRDSLSPEALAWRTNIIANEGTITPTQLAFFDTWFFKPALTAGNILTELDRLNIYCNLVGSEVAARTNMINLNHFVTPVNSPTFDINGYRSNGTTSYLNLNYNPKTQGVKLTVNSASVFAVVKNPSFASQFRFIGAFNSTFVNQLAMVRNVVPNLYGAVNTGGGTLNTNTTTSGNVFLATRRASSANQDTIINASIVNSAQLSTDIPNLNQFELAVNSNGSPIGAYDTMSHLCSGHGSGNLNISGLQTILNNLFTAAGI